jgi:CBS domain-containing protein
MCNSSSGACEALNRSDLVVCGDDGAAVGVITDTLVVRQFGQRQAGAVTARADAVMAQDFVACHPAEPLADVLALMHRRGLLHMPVIDDNHRPIGVINARDGLRALLAAGNHEEALLRDYVMGIGYQ